MSNQFSFRCKICAMGPELLAFIEKHIALGHGWERMKPRLAASGITMSRARFYIHLRRHRRICMRSRGLDKHESLALDLYEPQILVLWPDGQNFVQREEVCPRLIQKPADRPVLEMEVSFESEVPARCLESETETETETEKETMSEEKPGLLQRIKSLFHHKPAEPLHDPPQLDPCAHDMRTLGGASRCIKCGFQPELRVPVDSPSRNSQPGSTYLNPRGFGKFS